MKNLFIHRIEKQHNERLKKKLELIKVKNEEKQALAPIIINTETIFEDIMYQKLKGCPCNSIDNPLSCQICFFSLLSLHPNYKYTKTRLDKLIEYKESGGDITALEMGYSYCLNKIKNQ